MSMLHQLSKLGSGARFAAVAKSAGGGATGQKIAAVAGRTKWGPSKMNALAMAGKKKAA